MTRTFLLIGGNTGDRLVNLQQATDLIDKNCARIVRASAIYETAAWGMADQPAFLNQALEAETGKDPLELLNCLLGIEKKMGREREEKYGPRNIDIDIIFYGSRVVESPGLRIPHPRMQERRFVLKPIYELSPLLMHPLSGKTIAQLLEECEDPLPVEKYLAPI